MRRTVGCAGAGLATLGNGAGTTGMGRGVGVGVGATPARARGKSLTTASSVGSGVGWRSASTSADEALGPPPHAVTNMPHATIKDSQLRRIPERRLHARAECASRRPSQHRNRITDQDCFGGIFSFIPILSLSGSLPMVSL